LGVAVALEAVTGVVSALFDIIKYIGAAYLLYLGIGYLTSRGGIKLNEQQEKRSPVRQFGAGFLTLWGNPKALLFFGAFIPQFVDMSRDHFPQVALLGVTFMVVAGLTDAAYALLAGRVRSFFSARRTRMLSRVSGGFMIGGGVWLALTRSR
ncbi:MAG: LysE family translocator, partial [Bradyrhizobium sp.]|nr:LysE family translocator [Bradyrhizobium sp.]